MYNYLVREEDYKDLIDENEYAFVIYSATWCGPCKVLKQWLEEEYASFPHPILIIDVEEWEQLSADADVTALPTMVGFCKQKEFVRTQGFHKQELKKILEETLEVKEEKDDGLQR